MNQRNLGYLAETLAGLGFGDVLNDQLRTKMQLGFEKFEILVDHVQSNGQYVRFAPQLEKSKNPEYQDYYSLNSIRATHKEQNRSTIATAEFKINKKSGFSVEEMEKMLIEGRAVYRKFHNNEGEQNSKYYRLDINNLDENGKAQIISYSGRMDIERELDKLNIESSNKKDKQDTIANLKAGERVSASVRDGRDLLRISIESAPHKGGLAVLNKEGEIIKYTNSQAQSMQVVNEPGQTNARGMQAANENAKDNQLQNGNGKIKKAKEVLGAMNNQKESLGNKNKIK